MENYEIRVKFEPNRIKDNPNIRIAKEADGNRLFIALLTDRSYLFSEIRDADETYDLVDLFNADVILREEVTEAHGEHELFLIQFLVFDLPHSTYPVNSYLFSFGDW